MTTAEGSTKGSDEISFCGGALGMFPALDSLIERSLSRIDRASLLRYGDPSGDPKLRGAVAALVGCTSSDAEVLITCGGQHAVALTIGCQPEQSAADAAAKKTKATGETVFLLQQPCFFGAIRAIRAYHPESTVLTWQSAPELTALMKSFPRSVVYLTSNHSPLAEACSMTQADKLSVVRGAAENGCTVIEDNPYDVTCFDGSSADDSSTLFELSAANGCPETVVRLGSFSKLAGAGLRCGFIAHRRGAVFSAALRSAMITGSIFPTPVCQSVCREAISDPSYIAALKSFLVGRRDSFLGSMSRHLGGIHGVAWSIPRAGVHARLSWSTPAISGASLVAACKKHGVAVDSNRFSFLDGEDRPFVQLNFAQLDPSVADEGLRRIAAAFGELSVPMAHPAPLHVLVTSGGTAVPLDGVRVLTNMSQGTTGAMIAEELLRSGHRVTYLHAKGAKRPFLRELEMNPAKPIGAELERLVGVRRQLDQVRDRLREVEYYTFDDYMRLCKAILTGDKQAPPPDVGIFSAAVSDFGPADADEKAKMPSDSEMAIHLKLLPKVVALVKTWAPRLFLVTFKLLVSVSIDHLVEVAHSSGMKAHADLVVANTIEPGSHLAKRHTVIVTPEKGVTGTTVASLGKDLVRAIERRISARHWKTVALADVPGGGHLSPFKEQADELRAIAKSCSDLGLWLPYSEEEKASSGPEFGFVAVRLPRDAGFLITGRGSRKTSLADTDVVHVESVNYGERSLCIRSSNGRRASLNANVAAGLFRERSDVAVIVHTHVLPPCEWNTPVDFAPGTQEDFDAVVGLERASHCDVLGLVNHGIIAMGESFQHVLEAIGTQHTYRLQPEQYDVIYSRFQQASVGDFAKLVASSCNDKATRILDIAAGTGAAALALVAAGFHSICLSDKSSGMLEEAKRKLAAVGVTPSVFAVPMEQIDASTMGSFGAVVCRQAINYAKGVEGLRGIFRRVFDALLPGGIFVFNSVNFVPEKRCDYPMSSVHNYELAPGHTVHLRESNAFLDPSSNVLHHVQHCVVTKLDGEAVHRQVIFDMNSFAMFTQAEYAQALSGVGFAPVTTFGKGLASPCSPDSRTVYFVSTKP